MARLHLAGAFHYLGDDRRAYTIMYEGMTEQPQLDPAFQARLAEIQGRLQALIGLQLVDLHVSDLLNAQLPSHYDYTSQYDLLVFRRLATVQGDAAPP